MTGDHYSIFRLPSPPVVSRSRDVLCMFVFFANESFAEDCHEYVDITLHYRCCHLSKQKTLLVAVAFPKIVVLFHGLE